MTKSRLSTQLDQWVNHWATAASVGVLAMMVGFTIAYFEGDDMRADAEAIAVPPQYEQALIDLDRAAINKAYGEHVGRVFNIWITDGYEASMKSPRGVKGVNNARDAYVKAMDAIEEREKRIRR
jgi:hypothetical protein